MPNEWRKSIVAPIYNSNEIFKIVQATELSTYVSNDEILWV